MLLALTAASIAIAAGGPGKFQTKITGNGAKTATRQAGRNLESIDLANATPGTVKLTRNGKPARRRQIRDLGVDDQAHTKEGRQVHDQRQVPVQAARQDAHVQGDQRLLHDPQGRPDLRPVDDGAMNARRGETSGSPRRTHRIRHDDSSNSSSGNQD